jgi:hypothetical protein
MAPTTAGQWASPERKGANAMYNVLNGFVNLLVLLTALGSVIALQA